MSRTQFDIDEPIRWNDGWSRVPHGLWTLDLSTSAKVLLGWLHSHDPAFVRTIGINDCRRVTSSQATRTLDELAAAGFLTITPPAKRGGQTRIMLHAAPWLALLGNRAETGAPTEPISAHHRADFGSPTEPISAHIEDQLEDQRENNMPSESLRSSAGSSPDGETLQLELAAPAPPPVPSFDQWWDEWKALSRLTTDKRVGKVSEARNAWAKLKPPQRRLAMDGVRRHQAAVTPLSICPDASTWLNRHRWEDDSLFEKPAPRPAPDSGDALAAVRQRRAAAR